MPLLLEDLATFLGTKGYGVYDPTGSTSTIFVQSIPDTPDTLIALWQYPGRFDPTAWTFDSTTPQWELPRFQVTARGAPYDAETPLATIESIIRLFVAITDTSIAGNHYFRITPTQSGVYCEPVNYDKNGRRLFRASFEAQRTY